MSPFLALHTGVQTRIAGSNYGANKGERKWKNYSKRDLKRRISLLMAASSPSWQEMKKRKVVWGWEGGGTEFERTGSCFAVKCFLRKLLPNSHLHYTDIFKICY